ncbi:MAG: hypothetical protein ACPGVC_07075 [Salibacteraceae bacterium]
MKTKHQAYTDSLKNVNYDRKWPIWRAGAYKQGFDIPYPTGVMANFIWLDQGVLINNMKLGITTDSVEIPTTPIDFIKFGDNRNTSFATNVRPDLWVFPFLNVYGLFGVDRSKTEVNLEFPISMKSVVDQGLTTAGFGVLAAGGIGPVWVSCDFNMTWNYPELLDEPTRVNVLGLRMGHSFVFKNRPDRNINIWVGGMRLNMQTETRGEIAMKDALPDDTWDRRDEIVGNYVDWYENEATPAQKIVADKTLTPIMERLAAADGDAVVRYEMDKQTKEMWNGVIGGQFQFNKAWQFRTEFGVIGDRTSYLASINYRFLGPKTKKSK